MSSHKKNWKECSYVKNDHSRDSQSSFNQSFSNQSFRFSQIKFNKSKHEHQQKKTSKKFTLVSNSSRINEFKVDRSFLQQSNRMKQNSMIDHFTKEILKSKPKSSKSPHIKSKLKNFLYSIKKLHEDMKIFADNVLYSFQKMKQQLEINLLQVSSQLLKLGNQSQKIEKVRQIFQNGFAQIKRAITFLPESLTKLGNDYEQSKKDSSKILKGFQWSPMARIDSLPEGQSCTKIVSSIFINKAEQQQLEKQVNVSKDMEIGLISSELKSKPCTQRRKHQRNTSYENAIYPKTYRKKSNYKREIPVPIDDKKTVSQEDHSLGQVSKIDDIILQMRLILNNSD